MIEIWQECASLDTTRQRLADKVRKVMKKGWIPDLNLLEILQKINNDQDSNTVPDVARINKQKEPTKMTRQLQKVEMPHRSPQNDTKKIPNWKTPNQDGIHDFWFKKFTFIHDRLSLKMDRRLQGAHVPKWITKQHWSKKTQAKEPSQPTTDPLLIYWWCGKY